MYIITNIFKKLFDENSILGILIRPFLALLMLYIVFKNLLIFTEKFNDINIVLFLSMFMGFFSEWLYQIMVRWLNYGHKSDRK